MKSCDVMETQAWHADNDRQVSHMEPVAETGLSAITKHATLACNTDSMASAPGVESEDKLSNLGPAAGDKRIHCTKQTERTGARNENSSGAHSVVSNGEEENIARNMATQSYGISIGLPKWAAPTSMFSRNESDNRPPHGQTSLVNQMCTTTQFYKTPQPSSTLSQDTPPTLGRPASQSSSFKPPSQPCSITPIYRRRERGSSDEDTVCGCQAISSGRVPRNIRKLRTQSLHDPTVRDFHNANNSMSKPPSINSTTSSGLSFAASNAVGSACSAPPVASCKCRRAQSMYGIIDNKHSSHNGACDVIDSYLAKSQSMNSGFNCKHGNKNLNEMDGSFQGTPSNIYNMTYRSDLDYAYFQHRRQNLHYFDRNQHCQVKENNPQKLDESENEFLQNTRNDKQEEIKQIKGINSDCQLTQHDRNHLHQSCDLIAQRIGESEQRSHSMLEIGEHDETEASSSSLLEFTDSQTRAETDMSYDSDCSEDQLSLTYFVDMENSLIIQSDVTENYRTDKIQYIEKSPDECPSAGSNGDTLATYKYNANTQSTIQPSHSNDNLRPRTPTRFKTETKTTLLDRTEKSNKNACVLKGSESGSDWVSEDSSPATLEVESETASKPESKQRVIPEIGKDITAWTCKSFGKVQIHSRVDRTCIIYMPFDKESIQSNSSSL